MYVTRAFSVVRLYCGFEDAIEVFDVHRPGEGTRVHTTPSKKSRDGLKGFSSPCAPLADVRPHTVLIGRHHRRACFRARRVIRPLCRGLSQSLCAVVREHRPLFGDDGRGATHVCWSGRSERWGLGKTRSINDFCILYTDLHKNAHNDSIL